MLLPYVIQYLETLMRPSGGQLVEPGGFQIYMPAVPPNTLITYNILPATGYYAYIGYRLDWDNAMVPNAWYMTIVQWGMSPYSGFLNSKIIQYGIDHIVPVTEAEPCLTYARNVSPLAQYACITGYYVGIRSEDDYLEVLESLLRLETSSRSEALAVETNDLLRKLGSLPSLPRPPTGG
jgi:hypothetical protein